MIDYPIELNDFDTGEYDPFLSHVIRHKLRKRKNRRRLGRLIRKHPKARILRVFRRRRRSIRPVRRVRRRGYAKPIRRPIRVTAKPQAIGKPFSTPVKPGTPLVRNTPKSPGMATKPNRVKKPKVSRDIILPYKRRYGRRKPGVVPGRIPKVTIPPMERALPIMEDGPIMNEAMYKPTNKAMQSKSETQKAKEQKDKQKRTIKNIIGIAALSIVVVGAVAYKLKTKAEANGRVS